MVRGRGAESRGAQKSEGPLELIQPPLIFLFLSILFFFVLIFFYFYKKIPLKVTYFHKTTR